MFVKPIRTLVDHLGLSFNIDLLIRNQSEYSQMYQIILNSVETKPLLGLHFS